MAGTDPKDPISHLAIEEIQAGSAEVVLRWQSAANRVYRIYRADTLSIGWTEVASVIGDGSLQSWTDPQSAVASRFYRIAVEIRQ